jgi:hypothetical protein
MKAEIYEALRDLNHHFDHAAAALDRLQQLALLDAGFVEARKMAAEEIRARTNHAVAQVLVNREGQDWSKFEDLRIEAIRREVQAAIRLTEDQ